MEHNFCAAKLVTKFGCVALLAVLLQSAVVFPYIQLSELKTHHTELEKVQREIADKVSKILDLKFFTNHVVWSRL